MIIDKMISPMLFLNNSTEKLFCIDINISIGKVTFIISPLSTEAPSFVIILSLAMAKPIKIIKVSIKIEFIISV
jgi:hypothetical protein